MSIINNKTKNFMKKEQVLGVVRHALTFIGGILITKGLIGESASEEIIGGVISLVGMVWSVIDKKKAEK